MQRFPVVYRGITHAGVIWTFSRIHDPLSNHLYVHGIYVHVNVLSTALLTEDTVKWTIKYCKRKMVWNKGRFRFPTSGRTSNTKREYQKIVPKKVPEMTTILPAHHMPFPVYPLWQWQVKDPTLFVQTPRAWQVWTPLAHSSRSRY